MGDRAGRTSGGTFLAVALLLLLLKGGVVDRLPTPLRHTRLRPDGTLAGVSQPMGVNFGGRARLLGVDMPPTLFPADAAPLIRTCWQALDAAGGDWYAVPALVDADDVRRTHQGLRQWRWGRSPPPLATWPPDAYACYAHHLDVQPGTPPGLYTLTLALFDRAAMVPASVLGADGQPQGPLLVLGQVTLTRPRTPPSLTALGLPPDATPLPCPPLLLWVMEADRTQAAPGDVVALRWVWEATATPTRVLSATVTLRDGRGEGVRRWRLPPVAAWWPTDLWRAGDRWEGRPILRLPASLESGDYRLELALSPCGLLADVPLTIIAPQRQWTVPPDFVPDDVTLGGVIRLAGHQLAPAQLPLGGPLTVRLAWQALVEMETAYRVFVHLVGPDGHLWSQHDGEPAAWSRPTTGWAVGEVVVDAHTLDVPGTLPPGMYSLRVGVYRPDGVRLRTASGNDAVEVARWRVGAP